MTTVVNLNKSLYDVYIGRGSIFGNPYEIGIDGNREEVMARYIKWFDFMVRDDIFIKELNKLDGKILGCFCNPELCHGDIIAGFLNEQSWNKILK